MNTSHHVKKISVILLGFLVLFGASVTSAQTCDSATQYCRDLSVGMTGTDVLRLKTLLKQKGYFNGKTTVDNYTKVVKSGVEKLQQEYQQPVTGIVDSNLRNILNNSENSVVENSPVAEVVPNVDSDQTKIDREQKKAERALLKEQKKEQWKQRVEARKKAAETEKVVKENPASNPIPAGFTIPTPTGTIPLQTTSTTQSQTVTAPVNTTTSTPAVTTPVATTTNAPIIPTIPQTVIPEIVYSGTATSGYQNDIVFVPKENQHGVTGGLILNTSYSSGTPGVLPKFVYSPTIVFASSKFGYLPAHDGKVYSQQPVLRFQTLIKNPNNSYGLIELKSPKLDCSYIADNGEKYDLGKNYLNVSSLKFNEYGIGNGGWVISLASDYVPTSSHKIYQTAGLKLIECKMTYSELKNLDGNKTVSSTDNTANNVISMYVNIVK